MRVVFIKTASLFGCFLVILVLLIRNCDGSDIVIDKEAVTAAAAASANSTLTEPNREDSSSSSTTTTSDGSARDINNKQGGGKDETNDDVINSTTTQQDISTKGSNTDGESADFHTVPSITSTHEAVEAREDDAQQRKQTLDEITRLREQLNEMQQQDEESVLERTIAHDDNNDDDANGESIENDEEVSRIGFEKKEKETKDDDGTTVSKVSSDHAATTPQKDTTDSVDSGSDVLADEDQNINDDHDGFQSTNIVVEEQPEIDSTATDHIQQEEEKKGKPFYFSGDDKDDETEKNRQAVQQESNQQSPSQADEQNDGTLTDKIEAVTGDSRSEVVDDEKITIEVEALGVKTEDLVGMTIKIVKKDDDGDDIIDLDGGSGEDGDESSVPKDDPTEPPAEEIEVEPVNHVIEEPKKVAPEGSLASFFEKVNGGKAKTKSSSSSSGGGNGGDASSNGSATSFENLAQRAEVRNAIEEQQQKLYEPQPPQQHEKKTKEDKPTFTSWGVYSQEKHVPDMELLFELFENRIRKELGYIPEAAMKEAIFPLGVGNAEEDYPLSAEELAVKMEAARAAGAAASRSSEDFVEGLDDFDKFFEGVDPPDELDVGASGSSIQDVLVGKSGEILFKRILMGWNFVKRSYTTIKTKITSTVSDAKTKYTDNDGKISISKDDVKDVAIGIWQMSIKLVMQLVDFIDDLISGDDEDDFNNDDFDMNFRMNLRDPSTILNTEPPLRDE